MQPFWAPLVRSRRVSLRVSMLAMATVPSATRYCDSVRVARKLLASSGRSLMIRPAAWTLSASTSFLLVDAVVADVRIRQGDDLLAVAGVGEDFLVAGHRGVEHHFADGGAGGADRIADKDRAVCERQDGGREGSLKRQKHWVLRRTEQAAFAATSAHTPCPSCPEPMRTEMAGCARAGIRPGGNSSRPGARRGHPAPPHPPLRSGAGRNARPCRPAAPWVTTALPSPSAPRPGETRRPRRCAGWSRHCRHPAPGPAPRWAHRAARLPQWQVDQKTHRRRGFQPADLCKQAVWNHYVFDSYDDQSTLG
jgi:hypothetical protein